jgi:hypothetical protein
MEERISFGTSINRPSTSFKPTLEHIFQKAITERIGNNKAKGIMNRMMISSVAPIVGMLKNVLLFNFKNPIL